MGGRGALILTVAVARGGRGSSSRAGLGSLRGSAVMRPGVPPERELSAPAARLQAVGGAPFPSEPQLPPLSRAVTPLCGRPPLPPRVKGLVKQVEKVLHEPVTHASPSSLSAVWRGCRRLRARLPPPPPAFSPSPSSLLLSQKRHSERFSPHGAGGVRAPWKPPAQPPRPAGGREGTLFSVMSRSSSALFMFKVLPRC